MKDINISLYYSPSGTNKYIKENLNTKVEPMCGGAQKYTGEKAEICAWGFRNPHRCAFDSATDTLYCGDVGQDRVEEVNTVE